MIDNTFEMSMQYLEDVNTLLVLHNTCDSELQAVYGLMDLNTKFIAYLKLSKDEALAAKLESEYVELLQMRQLFELDSGTEGIGTDILKYIWKSLVAIVKKIIDIVVTFFKSIFSEKAKISKKIKEFQKHFDTYGISPAMEAHVGNVAPLDDIIKQINAITNVGFSVLSIMDRFKSTGQMTNLDLDEIGMTNYLLDAGFSVVNDTNSGAVVISVAKTQRKTQSDKLGSLGWTATGVPNALAHVTTMMTSGTMHRIQELQKTLTTSMLDKLQDHVIDDNTKVLYNNGVKTIAGLVTGYGMLSVATSNSVLAVCEIARRYPNTK